ncbi:MAG TPA: uroporphyrinogen-III C-methyltransferase [Terriglobales bacterium]|nr:uroporphyrinogen-III C-methyltransferase [Terriglobales bacterium]
MSARGKVFLVGAGPGDPDLLTLKAAKVLRSADVVLHDELVSKEILRLIPTSAQLINVGKRCGKPSTSQEEINRLLVQNGLLGLQVVRLKGGDPFIFGRGGEELEALRQAGIEVEVVPGVTAALGAAASAQLPLTHRELSSTLVLVTGSSGNSNHVANWPEPLPSNATIVVYMPGHDMQSLQNRLISAGVSRETPCAIVSSATSESEQVHITQVASLADAPVLRTPRLIVIGDVVRLADPKHLVQFTDFKMSNSYAELSPTATENAR